MKKAYRLSTPVLCREAQNVLKIMLIEVEKAALSSEQGQWQDGGQHDKHVPFPQPLPN